MLEGELVRLRPTDMSDLERNFRWFSDREVTHYSGLRYPVSQGHEEWRMRSNQSSSFEQVRFAMETKDGRHIGNLELRGVSAAARRAELGIAIGDRESWGQGYGADAVRTVLRFAFDEMNLRHVWLTTAENNDRAIACYRKCGSEEEGRLRQDRYLRGRYWDTVVMGISTPSLRE